MKSTRTIGSDTIVIGWDFEKEDEKLLVNLMKRDETNGDVAEGWELKEFSPLQMQQASSTGLC